MTKRQRKRRAREATLTRRLLARPRRLQRQLLQLMSERDDLTIDFPDIEKRFPCHAQAARRVILAGCVQLVKAGLARVVLGGWQLTTTAWLKSFNAPSEAVRP